MKFVAALIEDIKAFAGIGAAPSEEAREEFENDLRRDRIQRGRLYADLRALDIDIDNFRIERRNPTA